MLWTTGPDTALDGIFRLLAMRLDAGGSWEVFDRTCDPFPVDPSGADPTPGSATARMVREFGVRRADLCDAVPLEEAWAGFRAFLGEGPVIVPDAGSFVDWCEHLDSRVGNSGVGNSGVAGAGAGPGPLALGLDDSQHTQARLRTRLASITELSVAAGLIALPVHNDVGHLQGIDDGA